MIHADNDGDSFRVRCGAKEFIVRLYFVDAPETNLRYPERTREQSEYFGATLDETMRAGTAASALVRETLQSPFTVWTRWASARGSSKEGRYYALVQVNNVWLSEIPVNKGLARRKGDRLDALEADAKRQRMGAWASPTREKTEKTPR